MIPTINLNAGPSVPFSVTDANLPTLDRLLSALRAARRAFDGADADAGHAALADAFAALGSLYAALDPGVHPEVTSQLTRVYDTCVGHIGEARPGATEGLAAATSLLSSLRVSLGTPLRATSPRRDAPFTARAATSSTTS